MRDRHASQDRPRHAADRPRPRGRPALPGRPARPGFGGPAHPHQRRRLGRPRPPSAARHRARVRDRLCGRRCRPSRSTTLQAGIALDEGLATLTGLRADDRHRDPPPRRAAVAAAARPALVSGDPRPGLEAPAAPDVRRGRCADRAAGPRPDRAGPPGGAAERPRPATSSARDPRPRGRRRERAVPAHAARRRVRRLAVGRLGAERRIGRTMGEPSGSAAGSPSGILPVMTPTARQPGPATPAPDRGARRPRLVRQEQRRGGGGPACRLPVLRHRAALPGHHLARPGSRRLGRRPGRPAWPGARGRARRRRRRPAVPCPRRRRRPDRATCTVPRVDRAVSVVAAVPELRAALLDRQRAIAAARGIVMAGRDIGTVVLPDADLKLFLDASVDERARRRTEERGLDPAGSEAREILAALRRRDELDATRAVAPLRAAADARIITTDGNRLEDTVDAVVNAILDAEARSAAASMTGATASSLAADRRRAPMSDREPIDSSITPLISVVAFGGRVFARAMSRISIEGAVDEIPRDGPLIIAANHASNFDAPVLGAWLIPQARPADPLARQARAVRVADRRLGGGQRRRPPGRSRQCRRGGVPARRPDPRRRPRAVRLSRGDAQPRRRAPGGTRRARAARAAERRTDRPDRDRRLEPGVAQGPAPAAPGRTRHGPGRAPVPSRRRAPVRDRPEGGERPA